MQSNSPLETTTTPEVHEPAIPLCIDLDGTLIRTDILVESLMVLLKSNVAYLFRIPFWLLKGKAYLKDQIARRVDLDIELLPYNERFLEYLRREHTNGRALVLATATHIKFARQIADHLGIFQQVLASSAETNLSGDEKLTHIRAKLGAVEFDYAGNDRKDLAIWPHARRAIVVNPEPGVLEQVKPLPSFYQAFEDEGRSWNVYLRAARLHQWLKNLLLFVPLFAAHEFANPQLFLQACLAFLAFGLCASSVYMLNDLLDLSADRQHPRKRFRPFAAGTISILRGVLLIPVLLGTAFALTPLLPVEFFMVMTVYYLSTLSYSLWLKREPIVDVLLLAALYTLRILAGAAAVSVTPSFWLLALSLFLFLSLGLLKRYAELLGIREAGKEEAAGRGYRAVDIEMLASLGGASGYIAVLVLALYVNSDQVHSFYQHPQLIWFLCPLLLYWVSRVWMIARRGQMHDDPVIFALRDWGSRCIALVGIAILLLAI